MTTVTPVQQIAIGNADVQLNNAALPTYTELKAMHADLVKALQAAAQALVDAHGVAGNELHRHLRFAESAARAALAKAGADK